MNTRRRVSFWVAPALMVGLPVLTALILLAMGRTPWIQSGRLALWSGDAWGPENSQQFTDPYTFTHFIHGAVLYALLRRLARRRTVWTRGVLAVAIECVWEVVENTDLVIERYRAATLALGYYGDSVINSAGDILACMLGFMVTARVPVRAAVLACLLVELALAYSIRDGLLLNIVMLAHPIEAVKRWQAGG